MAEAADADTTRDAFFGGRILVRQPAKGHRSGTDAVLLAAAVPGEAAGLVVDVGAGVGVAGLGVAIARRDLRVALLELDPASLALARLNVAEAGFAGRVEVCAADVLVAAARRASGLEGRADVVISNPPFLDAARARVSPDPARRAAHVAGAGGLAAWVAACLALASPKGELVLIHRADAVPALLEALRGRAGGVTLLPVQRRAAEPATRVLLRATKGSRAPFRLAPTLVLHAGDAFTPEADRLHRGEAAIDW